MDGKSESNEAYVDTSAFIAFCDRSDSYHGEYLRLFSGPPPLVTSSLVVAEGHGWFLRRYDQRRAIQFLALIRELTPLRVLPFGADDLRKATTLLGKFSDQRVTLGDLHGLVLMRDRRIRQCWSTDRHLGLMGAHLVPSHRLSSLPS
jgi:predicted nucleic acid-binding protein